jgi:pimeloyl-ACP methyl ester carboxylesterase
MQIKVRDLEFDVKVGGADNGVPVLLLHGFPQNAAMWDAVCPALHAAGLRTIVPDQRGYSPGARPGEVDAYDQRECVADALAILDALGHRSVHVVGHDWGALVGWAMAAGHPERVSTLTAVSVPHPRAVTKALLTDADQSQRLRYLVLFRQPGKAEDVLLDDDAARLRAMLANSGRDQAHLDRYVAPLQAPGALTATLNWYRAYDLLDPIKVGKITVPVTFVWGDGDPATGRTAAENCAAEVAAGYRFVALRGVGHYVADQAPDALVAAILDRIGPTP